jgi:hypothetical protein
VIIDHRASLEPYLQDLLVGPLPLKNSTTTYESLTYPYTRKTEGRVRNLEADQDVLFYEWVYNHTASILDITLDLWNGSILGLDNDTLDFWGVDPCNKMMELLAGTNFGISPPRSSILEPFSLWPLCQIECDRSGSGQMDN